MQRITFGKTGGGIKLDYHAGDALAFVHDCAGGCGRKISRATWCSECHDTREKYKEYSDIIIKLGAAGHRCGTCSGYVGGCQHTYQAMIIAIEEKWPMVERLK